MIEDSNLDIATPDIQPRSMSYRHKFEHSHDHTNVDPCWYFIQYTPSQPGEKAMSALKNIQGLLLVFHKVQFYPCDYNVMKSNKVETT